MASWLATKALQSSSLGRARVSWCAEDEPARQRETARVQREIETLQLQVQAAQTIKRIVALEAQAGELRLGKLEERLKKYPLAAQWDVESA